MLPSNMNMRMAQERHSEFLGMHLLYYSTWQPYLNGSKSSNFQGNFQVERIEWKKNLKGNLPTL